MLQLAREIQEILVEEARSVLEAGWAEVRVVEDEVGPSVCLEPMKLEAAPLEVFFDSEELVVCKPGRNAMTIEFFSDSPEEIRDDVRVLAAAVLAGKYSERSREGLKKIVAEWPGPEGKREAQLNVLFSPRTNESGWSTVTYEPY